MTWSNSAKRYYYSEKGKISRKRYWSSEKGKQTSRRYRARRKEKQQISKKNKENNKPAIINTLPKNETTIITQKKVKKTPKDK